jgi:hypothetical protein
MKERREGGGIWLCLEVIGVRGCLLCWELFKGGDWDGYAGGDVTRSGIVPVFGHLNPFGDLVKQWAGVTVSLPI